MSFIVIGRGHFPGRGASFGDRQEYADLPAYLMELERCLRSYGVEVARIGGTTLAGQQDTAAALINAYRKESPGARCAFLACHLNAGGAEYQRSVIFYDQRSSTGQAMASAFSPDSPIPAAVKAAHRGDYTARAYACIERIYAATPGGCCGLVIEALSLDRDPYSAGLLSRVAASHALKIAGYLRGES
jgi:hypothetical protein